MPPASLTEEMYCLWRHDKNLQNSYPWIEKGDPHHLSNVFTFHDKWAEWEKDHPEVIQKARELLAAEKGTAPPQPSTPPPQLPPALGVPLAHPIDLPDLKALTDAILSLARAIEKLEAAMLNDRDDPPGVT